MKQNSIVIVGGGLAGLVAAIDLSKKKYDVTLIEKNEFPKHKVCGEYISNEVLPYLKSLGLDINSLHPKHIDKLSFSLVSGKSIYQCVWGEKILNLARAILNTVKLRLKYIRHKLCVLGNHFSRLQ